MSGNREVTYRLELGDSRRGRKKKDDPSGEAWSAVGEPSIPRIARLMALAIRMEGLLREGTMRDYAELAKLGRVTRARMTQITQLLLLAPDLQEQILFLKEGLGLNERKLRPVVQRIDWNEQRRLFAEILRCPMLPKLRYRGSRD